MTQYSIEEEDFSYNPQTQIWTALIGVPQGTTQGATVTVRANKPASSGSPAQAATDTVTGVTITKQ